MLTAINMLTVFRPSETVNLLFAYGSSQLQANETSL